MRLSPPAMSAETPRGRGAGAPDAVAALPMARFHSLTRCRICGSADLISVLNLGEQALTGVFPRRAGEALTRGPLELVWCGESGLLQLAHSYDLGELYGENYGYRSGLNASMVAHLQAKVAELCRVQPLQAGDIVLDIGSNDGTLLAG